MAGDEWAPAEPRHEEVIARLRPHGRVLFWPALIVIAVSGVTGFFSGTLPEPWQNQALPIAAAVVVLVACVFPLIRWSARRYTITTRRIIIRRGFLVRTRQELMHSRGYDLTVRKNGMQSIFGSGDVLINTGLDRPTVLWDVPNADLVQSTLHDLMEDNLNAVARMRQLEQAAPAEATAEWKLGAPPAGLR